VIEIQHLRYRYRLDDDTGLEALRSVSAVFRPDESVAIVGPNGSGKSTLALCLNGLLQPSGGRVLVDGLDVAEQSKRSEIRRLVGMVFQNPDNQIISTTVEREIAFGLENLAVPADELRQRVEQVLEQFHLLPFRDRPPHLLSGGEKQRLSIAAVLAMRPRYLILDEPTSLLDPVSQREVGELIDRLHRTGEVAVVHITQFPEEAARAQRVLVLHRGELVMEGPPESVFSRHEDLARLGLRPPFAQELAGRLRGRGVELGERAVTSLEDLAERLDGLKGRAAVVDRGSVGSPDRETKIDRDADAELYHDNETVRATVGTQKPKTISSWKPKPPSLPASDTPERIRCENLWYRYHAGLPTEQVALKGVDLTIRRGELIGLVGSIGSGKSTLVQHFNGLLEPARGRVLVDGVEVGKDRKALTEIRRRVGLVFQFPEKQLFEETVFEDVAFSPRNAGLSDEQVEHRVHRALEQVGLDIGQFAGRSPFDLSGGEQRRVAIAGVLAQEPEILILDEPFVGLDPEGCSQIQRILRQLHEEGATLVLISHHMDLVAALADRLVVMQNGKVAADDLPRNIFGDPGRTADLGIDLPQPARLSRLLKERGWEIEAPALTLEEAEGMVVQRIDQKQ
jgi:energy-coupling factor transport system ATP-binding protein